MAQSARDIALSPGIYGLDMSIQVERVYQLAT